MRYYKMFWICDWFDSDGRHILGKKGKFLLFKYKKNAVDYLEEKDANFKPNIIKISLEKAKKLFGNYEYEII